MRGDRVVSVSVVTQLSGGPRGQEEDLDRMRLSVTEGDGVFVVAWDLESNDGDLARESCVTLYPWQLEQLAQLLTIVLAKPQ